MYSSTVGHGAAALLTRGLGDVLVDMLLSENPCLDLGKHCLVLKAAPYRGPLRFPHRKSTESEADMMGVRRSVRFASRIIELPVDCRPCMAASNFTRSLACGWHSILGAALRDRIGPLPCQLGPVLTDYHQYHAPDLNILCLHHTSPLRCVK